jgi:hypothetical protein
MTQNKPLATTTFARCTACNASVRVMREREARAGGWLSAVDPTCRCGASHEHLVPTPEGETQQLLGPGMPAVVMVPDEWPSYQR